MISYDASSAEFEGSVELLQRWWHSASTVSAFSTPVTGSSFEFVNTHHNWWDAVLTELAWKASQSQADAAALQAGLSWIRDLPIGTPRPTVSVGEDGSVAFEWDRNRRHINVLFENAYGEFYYEDDHDSWETALDAGADKIDKALRAISAF